MKTNIEVGDFVRVAFDHFPEISRAEVLYIPCASGDSWHLRIEATDFSSEKLVYVQNYTFMELL